MNFWTLTRALIVAGATLCANLPSPAANPGVLGGSIVGRVRDPAGVPQMGATVVLMSRNERPLQRVLTGEQGEFAFPALAPDVYSIRVSLASFLPALKRNIIVQPGMQSLLSVDLATLFSSIELDYALPGRGPVMSDDWKWVLRASHGTRPVLRYTPDISSPSRSVSPQRSQLSQTHGVVRVSAGDQARFSGSGSEPDLGTAFALATSVFGTDEVLLSGNVGFSSATGTPATSFQTGYRREMPGGQTPEVRLTVRQFQMPLRVAAGSAWLSGRTGSPLLRTFSATMLDQSQLTANLLFEYGFSLDSVTFLDRLNYFSPYARLTYDGGEKGVLQISYSSGTPPAELFSSGSEDLDTQLELAALAAFPRVSLMQGTAKVQRSESYEIGYRVRINSRTYSAAAYIEQVTNAAVMAFAGGDGIMSTSDLLPDLFSNSWVLNAGKYSRSGYLASVTQHLGDHFDLTLAYSNGGALTAQELLDNIRSAKELRSQIAPARRRSVTVRGSGTLPQSGTQFTAGYQWSDTETLTLPHIYVTDPVREGVGMNVMIRQPIGSLELVPGRLEATAEMRNILAQGYIPLNLLGRRAWIVHAPRTVRGGFNFIF